MDWKTEKYSNRGRDFYVNPNGNPYDNSGYYTQSRKFYDDYMTEYNNYWAEEAAKDPIARDADKWSNWSEMHDGVMWFDTAACFKGKFIGDVNAVTIAPNTSVNTQLNADPTKSYTPVTPANDANAALNGLSDSGSAFGTFWEGWYTGASYAVTTPQKDYANDPAYNKLVAPKDPNGPFQATWEKKAVSGQPYTQYGRTGNFRAKAWDTEISVTGQINWSDKELTTALNNARVDLQDDCDMDCQKRGSSLSAVAALMSTAYGIIALNALFMFIGAWRYRWRVCSVYCTMCACLVQVVILMLTAVMLTGKYNTVCMHSLTNTFEGSRWTMNDDFQMTFNLWFVSWILMLPFVCCGMCSAFVATK